MKKLLVFLFLGLSVNAYARNGTVLLIDKLGPKNDAFQGLVDSSQTVTNTTNFNHNLSGSDTDVQKALDTLDNMSLGTALNVSPHSVLFSTGGTTTSGNTGLQYDDSVSSLTLAGNFSFAGGNFETDSGSNGTFNFTNTTNGAFPVIQVSNLTTFGFGANEARFDLTYHDSSTGQTTDSIEAADGYGSTEKGIHIRNRSNGNIYFFIGDQKISFGSNSGSGGGASFAWDATNVTASNPWIFSSSVTLNKALFFTNATKTDKYGAGSGLCAIYNGCVPASQYSTPTSSTNYVAATFRSGTTSYWQLTIPMNDTFVDGSTFTVNVVWTSTVTSGNVVWNFQALTTTDTLTMDGTYGSVATVTDGANLNQSFNRSSNSNAITPTGPNLHSGQLLLQMFRGVSASDTLSGDARLLWVEVTYFVNKFSTR